MQSGAIDTPAASWRDWLVAFGALLIVADAFDRVLYFAFGMSTTLLPGLPVPRVLLVGVVAATGGLIAGHLRSTADCIRAAWPVWPAVVLAFVSTAWSEQPATTVLWATGLAAVSALGIALAVRFTPLDQAALAAAAATAIAASSIAVALVPTWKHSAWLGGAWYGMYIHKNLLGRIVALGVVAAAVGIASGRRPRPALAALLVCGGVALATRSRASLLSMLTAGSAVLLLIAARRWKAHATVILASGTAVVVLALVLLFGTPPGRSLMRRSETFNGRTRIWSLVVAGAMQRPWLGWGYGAFWPTAAGKQVLAHFAVPINHAHNGFVDLFAELGAVGVILVCVPLAVVAVGALRLALASPDNAAIWPAVYLVFFVASNAAESALLRHKIFWALYVAVACHLVPHAARRATAVSALCADAELTAAKRQS